MRERLAAGCGQLVFNYLGQLDAAVGGDSMFRVAGESAGGSHWGGGVRTHLLSVNASVAGGRLHMAWEYSRELHRRETIEGVAGWMAEELRALVEHCRQEGAGGFTPSDFPAARLSQEELDEFIASVG
jgi:non-ribosomal peptide synthase protein (TIGR01720 family)